MDPSLGDVRSGIPPELVEQAMRDMRRQGIVLDAESGRSYRGLSPEEVVDLSVTGMSNPVPRIVRSGVAHRSLLERTSRH